MQQSYWFGFITFITLIASCTTNLVIKVSSNLSPRGIVVAMQNDVSSFNMVEFSIVIGYTRLVLAIIFAEA